MNVKGTWRAKAFAGADMTSPLKWGTGYNPIHAQYGDRVGNDPGRSMIAIHDSVPGNMASPAYAGAVDPNVIDQYAPEFFGYCDEDISYTPSMTWGYGSDTGTADRPDWGQGHDQTARSLSDTAPDQNFPAWGPESSGLIPGGSVVRSRKHGGGQFDNPDANDAKVIPEDDVAQGWLNKEHSYIEDAETSDVSQYEMNTSMTQRDKVREGSQISGTASEYSAPVASRITGMKLRQWGASPDLPGHAQRHDDMFPKQQDLIVRPFWLRTAGTGNAENMKTNELYVSEPKQRTPPADAWQGEAVTQSVSADEYGYTDEEGFYA
jgi:hypothetical protein